MSFSFPNLGPLTFKRGRTQRSIQKKHISRGQTMLKRKPGHVKGTSLNLLLCLTPFRVKRFLLKSSLNTQFEILLFVSCPHSVHSCKAPWSILFKTSVSVLWECYEISWKPSLLEAEQVLLPQPSLHRTSARSPNHPHGSPLNLLQQFVIFFMSFSDFLYGGQN